MEPEWNQSYREKDTEWNQSYREKDTEWNQSFREKVVLAVLLNAWIY
jgi:uncharacterized protein YecT (DUF1311 family)